MYFIEYHTAIKKSSSLSIKQGILHSKSEKNMSQKNYVKTIKLLWVCLNVLYMSMEKGMEEYKRC